MYVSIRTNYEEEKREWRSRGHGDRFDRSNGSRGCSSAALIGYNKFECYEGILRNRL